MSSASSWSEMSTKRSPTSESDSDEYRFEFRNRVRRTKRRGSQRKRRVTVSRKAKLNVLFSKQKLIGRCRKLRVLMRKMIIGQMGDQRDRIMREVRNMLSVVIADNGTDSMMDSSEDGDDVASSPGTVILDDNGRPTVDAYTQMERGGMPYNVTLSEKQDEDEEENYENEQEEEEEEEQEDEAMDFMEKQRKLEEQRQKNLGQLYPRTLIGRPKSINATSPRGFSSQPPAYNTLPRLHIETTGAHSSVVPHNPNNYATSTCCPRGRYCHSSRMSSASSTFHQPSVHPAVPHYHAPCPARPVNHGYTYPSIGHSTFDITSSFNLLIPAGIQNTQNTLPPAYSSSGYYPTHNQHSTQNLSLISILEGYPTDRNLNPQFDNM